jgi:iron(III) transport system permease protein
MNTDKAKQKIRVYPWRSVALFFLTALVLVYGVVYPNLFLVISSFQRTGSWTLANYREILSQGIVIEAIVSSVGLSIGTVLFCALVGVPLAFLFERYTFPGRRLFAALAALPLVLPPLVGTVAFIFLCGEYGILAHGIRRGGCVAGLPCSSFTLTRCIRFSTCS